MDNAEKRSERPCDTIDIFRPSCVGLSFSFFFSLVFSGRVEVAVGGSKASALFVCLDFVIVALFVGVYWLI